jgi:hypothetical protein
MPSHFLPGHRGVLFTASLILLIGVAATAWRTVRQYQTPGPFDPIRQGMCDFHNGIYFPARALIDGVSPYGQTYADTSPVARQIPFFLPSVLVLHVPFALLSLHVGEVAYFLFSVLVMLAIGAVVASAIGKPIRLDIAVAVAAGLVFSRGGHITLFDGYFTFVLILATFLAIHWGRDRPIAAAIMLVIVASKPTYILPLGFLMLARGNVKAIVVGAVLTIAAAAVPTLWLAHHEGDGNIVVGLQTLQEQIAQTQEIHRGQEDESPVHSWTRIDALAIVAKWSGWNPKEAAHLIAMAVLLVPPMIVLDRRRRHGIDDGLVGSTGAIVITATLVSLYHQSYDTMLLLAPLAAVIASGFGSSRMRSERLNSWAELPMTARIAIAGLMAVPLLNYLSTRMVLGRIDVPLVAVQVVTSINGVALVVLLAILTAWMWRIRPAA